MSSVVVAITSFAFKNDFTAEKDSSIAGEYGGRWINNSPTLDINLSTLIL